jgi:putative RecB family exonuclease
MALPLPTSLSPSKVSSFTDCALAFRFSAIDHLPEPPSEPAMRGSLVHAALEQLYALPAPERTLPAALSCLAAAADSFCELPEYAELGLDVAEEQAFLDEAERLVRNALVLEDPTTIHPIGIELRLEVEVEGLRLIGIIDRLELDADGRLVVTDYKTGRAPSEKFEQGRLGGVHFYSLLCEELFGQRPAKVQLLHLAEPVTITSYPTDQSTRGLRRKVGALWQAVERACEREDFRPKPGPLCSWCSFRDHCPAVGGVLPAPPSITPVEHPALVAAS